MKKTLVAIAALAVIGAASAEVTLSGGVGIGITSVQGGNAALTNLGDTGATNLTITSKEDLGGGLKLTSQLQMRVDSTTGVTTGGALYEGVTMQLDGSFGSLIAGRYQAPSTAGFDAFGRFGDVYAGVSNASTRLNRQIGYTTPNMNGFAASFHSTIDPVLNGARSEEGQMRVSYAAGKFASALTVRSLAAGGSNGKNLGLSYDLGAAKIMTIRDESTAGVKNNTFGVVVPMGAVAIQAQVRQGDSASQTAVGATYALSKATSLVGAMMNETLGTSYRLGIKTAF